jgi:hypothetical protein
MSLRLSHDWSLLKPTAWPGARVYRNLATGASLLLTPLRIGGNLWDRLNALLSWARGRGLAASETPVMMSLGGVAGLGLEQSLAEERRFYLAVDALLLVIASTADHPMTREEIEELVRVDASDRS